jgi:hypothetical protein
VSLPGTQPTAPEAVFDDAVHMGNRESSDSESSSLSEQSTDTSHCVLMTGADSVWMSRVFPVKADILDQSWSDWLLFRHNETRWSGCFELSLADFKSTGTSSALYLGDNDAMSRPSSRKPTFAES